MAIIKCKMCGGDLNLIDGASTAECIFCGSVQTIPNLDDEKKLIQFERAERLRKQCEFDKAAGIYETIVADFRQEAEAYWGLVLCKFGIEYVDDPATGKKIPTCHRSSFDSIMEDSDFEQALENADGTARRVYREEAKAIEEIRKGIIEVSNNEKPYDIFICYKETDENGDRTPDSVLAQDVYDALTDKGYRVFFSRITLEDKLGMEYEPYIFAALNSAKIMLAFGTDYEYFNAVWVKNEWSRFLKLMAKDKEKHLIPCFKGIDAYDMPKEFARLQAQDLGKVGAIQDLLRGVEKILPRSKAGAALTATATVIDLDALLKRGWMALEDGAWNEAAKAFDQVLDRDPESCCARLGSFLAGKQIRDMAEAEERYETLFYDTRDNSDVKRIRKLADTKLAVWFQRLDAETKERKEQAEKERLEREEQRTLIRAKLKGVRGFISAGGCHTVGLMADGTVEAAGSNDNSRCDVGLWTDIVALSAGGRHTVGLKSDGTVVAVGDNYYNQCGVSSWTDIVAISAGGCYTVGLRADGTVVAAGPMSESRCDVGRWTDIVAISAGGCHTVGLKSDGTMVVTKHTGDHYYGECDVDHWLDIVAISAGSSRTVGLKSDGTVVAVGNNCYNQCDVDRWSDIVAISAGDFHTVGLKSDGTVVAVGLNGSGQCDVGRWTDIVAISAGDFHTVGLRADGTIVAVGNNDDYECDVDCWKLFQDYEKIEEEQRQGRKRLEQERIERERLERERLVRERIEQERLKRERLEQERLEQERLERERQEKQRVAYNRRQAGLCQHCGGELKGFFSKKCISCGKPKDY